MVDRLNQTSHPVLSRTSAAAVWSLVLGILGWLMFGVTAIPAVICGHVARSRIRVSRGSLTGHGLALAGLILGYIQIGFGILLIPLMAGIAIPSFAKAKADSEAKACISNLRLLDAAKEQAAMEHDWKTGMEISRGGEQERSVLEYVKGGRLPTCPSGGTYKLNPYGQDPTCSVPRHALPQYQ